MHKKKNNSKTLPSDPPCTNPICFFCIMNEPNPSTRKPLLAKCFKEMPEQDSQEHVLALSGLWKIAMTRPNNPEFPSLGIFTCLAKFITRGVNDPNWLQSGQNVYIPYYAAHVIGSYTMNKREFAQLAVESGVVPPLMELLRGKMTWVEQRVAVRALAHLLSHEKSFEAIDVHESEIVKLGMEIASDCVVRVYDEFVGLGCGERKKYHCDLLTRGLGGSETEERKAEEWAWQLQSWSLSLLSSFASRDRCVELICEKKFLERMSTSMWGGLENRDSKGGIGLIRTLCDSSKGRICVANSKQVIDRLCNLSRSFDDQRSIAIESLLIIVQDPETRFVVLDRVVPFLADLVEARRIGGIRRTGDRITQALLQGFSEIKHGEVRFKSDRAEEIWELKVERKKKDKQMTEEEIRERKAMVGLLKKEGNERFWCGEIEEAVKVYDEALGLCRLEMRRERIVLYSNRAQCFLLMKKPERTISDATRAICLSGEARPHRKSLWRRSQAFDMKGLARESLMDCLMFINGNTGVEKKGKEKIPCYAVRMINKQMNATWIFRDAKSKKWEDLKA